MFENKAKSEQINELETEHVVEVLKALAHPVRLRLVLGLLTQACPVNHLAECLHISQPVVSQQLRILRQTGVLKQTRVGKQVYYELADDEVLHVVLCLFPQFK